MRKQKNIRMSIAVLIVSFVLLVAIPSSKNGNDKNGDFSILSYTSKTEIKSQSKGSDDLEKYERPAYFNLFKFICSFIPNRQKHNGKMMDFSSAFLMKSIIGVAD